MEIRFKRFLSLLLTLVMVISLMPANLVFAAEEETVADDTSESLETYTYDFGPGGVYNDVAARTYFNENCSCGSAHTVKEHIDASYATNGWKIAGTSTGTYDLIQARNSSSDSIKTTRFELKAITVDGETVKPANAWVGFTLKVPETGKYKITFSVNQWQGSLIKVYLFDGALTQDEIAAKMADTSLITDNFIYSYPSGNLSSQDIEIGESTITEGACTFVLHNVRPSGETRNVYLKSIIMALTEKLAAPVASVNGVEHTDLQEAIDAAAAGDTVTLLSDVTLDEGIVIAADDKITLDLAGYTITGTPAEAKAFAVITNKGELTITGNGTILCDHHLAGSTAYAVNTITNAGKLTVENGVIENKSTASNQIGYAIDNNSTSADATVIIEGGEVKASGSGYYDGIRQFCNSLTNENSVTVNGGSVSTIWMQNPSDQSDGSHNKDVKGSIAISGGTVGALYLEPSTEFEAAVTGGQVNKISYHQSEEGRDLTDFISGGIIGGNVDPSLIKEGYKLDESGNVVADPTAGKVAKVGENYYADLQEAIVAAAPGGTVELLSNVTVDKWIMFSQTLSISNGNIITLDKINGLTINGNGYKLTVKSIESAGNGNRLFYDADNLNIQDLTIECVDDAAKQGGIGLTSGLISNVTFLGGNGVFPGEGDITISGCTFKTGNHAIYYEEERDNLVVDGNTFELADDCNVILLRGDTKFTNNTVISGRTVNVVSGSPMVSGNNFNDVRLKVYNEATAAISGNTINNLVFNDETAPAATFTNNTLSAEAQAALDAVIPDPVAQVGETTYTSVLDAMAAAIEAGASEVKLLADSRELMPTDIEWVLNADLTITADVPVKVAFNNEGTAYDIVVNSNNNNTLTISENVHIELEDRVIWLGYYGNNVDVIVEGTLEGYQIWHGADTTVTETGTLVASGEAMVLRRGATLTVDGGKINANYFSILSGNIDAKNATIVSGPIWVSNTGNYDNEGGVSLKLDNSTWTSTGNIKLASEKTATMELTNGSVVTTVGASVIDANSAVVADSSSSCTASGNSVFVATVGEMQYTSLQSALNAAADGNTVKLLTDLEISETIVVETRIVLDLNGKTLSTNTAATLLENRAPNFWIRNTAEAVAKIVNTVADGVAIWNRAALLVSDKNILIDASNGTALNSTGAGLIAAGTWLGNVVHTGFGQLFSGGEYSADVTAYCSDGYATLPTLDGTFVVGEKPTATVNNLGEMTVPAGDYYIYDGSLTTGTEDMPLNFVMQFVADQDAEDMQTSPYASWYADFVITFEGIEGGSFDPSGCYLAGYYGSTDSWDGLWVKIPVEGVLTSIDEGTRYPVMMGVGMPQTYDYICSGVQAFSCAMYIPEEILTANPNLKVNLELSVVDSSNDAKALEALQTGNGIFKTSETSYTAEDFKEKVAQIGTTKYTSLTEAIEAAAEGDTIVLLTDLALSETVKIPAGKILTLDLNGKTITGTDNATGSFGLIENRGDLTITDSAEGGKITLIATNDRDWNAYSSVISNTVGGKLTVEAGTIEHLGGSDMAYGIDNLTNGKGTYAETVINGGTVKSPYRAIRQFLNGIEAQNILTVNGGTIEGANKSIWMQDPSKNANTGTLTVGENANLVGDVYLFVTAGSTEWPVEVAIAETALAENFEILTGNVPSGYELVKTEGVYGVKSGVAKIGTEYYATLAEAVAAAEAGDTIVLLTDVVLDAPITVKESITLDGAGYSITQSAACNNNIALLYFEGAEGALLDVTVKNVTFDGLKTGAAIRTLYANMTIDGCVFQNCEHTVGQGLVRLTYGNATITGSKFLNNNCSMAVSFNWDADATKAANDTLTIENCEFSGNTANKTALVYYVKGVKCTLNNNKFIGNNVNCADNGAVVYMGFTEYNVITGNLFKDNVVTEANTSTRVAGAIFFGYETTVTDNAFINNTASNSTGAVLGQVCTSTYYECSIDLSKNYWGGAEPVYGKDYTIQHQTGDANFIVDSYYAAYDEATNTVSELIETNYVAQIGKVPYKTFEAAYAAAQPGETIELLADVTLTGKLTVNKAITIDGNDHSIIANHTAFIVETSADCTFKDVTLNTNNKAKGVKIASGNVVFDNVTIPNSNKSDAITVYGTLNIKNYFSVESTYQVFDARNGVVTAEPGTVFDFTSRIGLAFPAKCDFKSVVDTEGNPFFCAYASTSYYTSLTALSYTDLVLLDDATMSSTATVSGTLDLNGHNLTVADGKTLKVSSNLTVTGEGNITGDVVLTNAAATLTAAPNLDVTTTVDGYAVEYVDGVYKLAQYVAQIGETKYTSLAAAVADVQEGETVTILSGTISEGTIKLPATLKNVTIKGEEGAILKDMTIMAADGNSYSYEGLTFDGITFENSRLIFTGWRNGGAVIKDLAVTNCTFQNLDDTSNNAPVHINMAAAEAVENFTFAGNMIDGVTGGSKSGVYAQVTGNVVVENNTINNVSFRPYVIQVTTDDGIADNFTVTGNTFSGSAAGRAQGLGNNSAGTDTVNLVVSGNIFKDITDAQQICYWSFNPETTTADLSKNYYDIDILNNPSRIYYNSAAADAEDLIEMGVYPYYADEAMTTLVTAPAIMVTYPVGNPVYPEGKVEYYNNILDAVPYTTNCPRLEGATIKLLSDIEGAGIRMMENDMVLDLNGHTYTIVAGTGSQGTNTSGFQIRPEVTTVATIKNGTIQVAEGAPVVWMFNVYATDFVVEDVIVDCANMAYSYGESCYVSVSREGDNVQFTGNTQIKNFNSEVAGAAYSNGGTMTFGEGFAPNGTIVLGAGATLTAGPNLDVTTTEADSRVVYKNGVYSVEAIIYVAEVNGVKYETLAEALTAAKNGDTVTLIADVNEVINIPDGLKVTLDLNGKTLNGSILAPNADLTVTNGSIKNTNSGVSALEINAGKLTLTDVNIDSARHAVRIDGAVEAMIDGGIYRSAIGNGTGTYHAVNISGAAVVTVKNGTFVGPKGTVADSGSALMLRNPAKVTIEGGSFSGGKNSTLGNKNEDSGVLSVAGGTFDQPVAAEYCAEGYIPADNGDGTYGVKVAPKAHFETGAYASTAPSKPREHLSINVYDIVAYESLVIKVYDTNGNHIVTSTYREYDLDDLETYRYPVTAKSLSVNIVVSGKVAGSWDNVWHIAPSVANIPATFEVYVDGNLADTWTEGFKSEAEKNDYIAFEGVYKAASVSDTAGNVSYFATLQYAIDAAAEGDIVTLLTDLTEGVVIAADDKITLDLNGCKITSEVSTIVVDGGELTVKDSGTEGKIISTNTNGDYEGIAVKNGGKLTLESGSVESGYFGIYAYSSVGHIVMTGGTVNAPYMAIAAGAGSVSITGGTVICDTYIVYDWDKDLFDISGGIFSQKPDASYIVEGYGAKEEIVDGATWYRIVELDPVAKIGDTEYKTIKAALAAWNEGDVIELLSDVTIDANENSGYSKAGVVVNGQVIDGKGHTLTVNGAGGTWDCGIYITAGTVKNLTVKGSFRGIFTAGASDDIYLDNVNFENVVYTFNSDAGNKNYGVYISNSKLNGWTSYSDAHKEVVFTNCSFGKGGDYAFCRPYNTTTFDNCTFEDSYAIDGTQSDVTFKGMDAESAAALVNGEVAMIANGEAVAFYPTLAEAIAAAGENDTVTLLADIELTETVIVPADKIITLDLNGKTINGGWDDETAGKHIYAFTNNGDLTITGNGTINARGNNNYGKLTLESGTINAIDANGGYAVRTFSGATFTMNGGIIATTNEDGDAPGAGYDATTVRVDAGATFVMNDGELKNISNFTFAIDNGGTTTVNGGKISSVHTTVANYDDLTINGGEFTCDGLEGVTAHVIWADAGKTTINGGTFDGKDNFNGFNVDASDGATVEIKGGNFLSVHSGSLYGEGTIAVSGGKFFDPVAEERCAEGYIPADNGDGTYGVKEGSYVARNTTTGVGYETFEAAYAAAQTGETVELLAPIVVQAGETLTLDKDITISYTSNVAGEDMITNKGTLNIGGEIKITYNNTDNTGANVTVSTISCEPGSVLNITGGTVENKTVKADGSSIYSYAIDLLTNGNLGDVTATISGGTVYSDYMAIRQFNNGEACKNTLNVTGGYIYGAKRAIQVHLKNNAAYTNITGGKVEGGDYSLCFLTTSENLTVSGGEFIGAVWYSGTDGFICGGIFDQPVAEEYCAEGYIPTAFENGTYGVKVGSYVAQVGDKKFETLAEAVEAVADGGVIELLADFDGDFVIVRKQLTVMKNGFAINGEVLTTKGLGSYEDDDKLVVVKMEVPTADAGEKLAYIDIDNDGYVDETLMTLQAALDAAAAGDTVKLRGNLTVNAVVIIPNNVTLDIEKNVLTVNAMIALSGGKLLGAYDSAKNDGVLDGGLLKVARENLVLNAEAATVNGITVLPIWDPTDGNQCYRFSQIIVNTDPETDPRRGLHIDKAENTIKFSFKNQATSDLVKFLLENYGGTDLGFSVIARIEWMEKDSEGNDIVEYHNFVYSDETIKLCATNHQYFFSIANFSLMGIDLNTLKVQATFVTDSGATAFSETWTIANAEVIEASDETV